MKQRIYVDSSVIGGCCDIEFKKWSNALIQEFNSGFKIAVISELTQEEINDAPIAVRRILSSIPNDNIESVHLSTSAENLAKEYVKNKVVSRNFIADAQHIAIATIEKVDILVSWNFEHIVNINRIHAFNSINIRFGYPLLEIRTPREVLENEENI